MITNSSNVGNGSLFLFTALHSTDKYLMTVLLEYIDLHFQPTKSGIANAVVVVVLIPTCNWMLLSHHI